MESQQSESREEIPLLFYCPSEEDSEGKGIETFLKEPKAMESYAGIVLKIRDQLKEVFGIQEYIWLNKEFKADYGFDSIDIVELIIWAEEGF